MSRESVMKSARKDVPERWFEEAFGVEYLRVYRRRDGHAARREAAFAREALELAPRARVLDLCCGYGRHIPPLVAEGLDVVGLDRSSPLLERAREVLGNSVPLVVGDMRRLPFARCFDAVLSFFTSFGYFRDEHENRRVLAEIARVLRPGGRFLLDLIDRRHLEATLVPQSTREEDGLRIEERRWLTAEPRRVEKELVIDDGTTPRRYFESVRLYGVDEARDALASAGLTLERSLGDFTGAPHRAGETPRMILIGRRGEGA